MEIGTDGLCYGSRRLLGLSLTAVEVPLYIALSTQRRVSLCCAVRVTTEKSFPEDCHASTNRPKGTVNVLYTGVGCFSMTFQPTFSMILAADAFMGHGCLVGSLSLATSPI